MAGLELLHFINGVIQYFKIIFTKYIIISELLLLTKGLNEILLGNLLVRVRKWLDTDCTGLYCQSSKTTQNNNKQLLARNGEEDSLLELGLGADLALV